MASHPDGNDVMDIDQTRAPLSERTLRGDHGRHGEKTSASGSWSSFGGLRSFLGSDPNSHHGQGGYGRQYESTEQRLRRERNEAEDYNEMLKKEIERLKIELRHQQQAVLQTKESATRVHQVMQDKELFIGPQALDRTIQGSYTALFKNVRSWTRHLGAGKDVDIAAISPVVQKQFGALCPGLDDSQLTKILRSKSTTRYFLQGWVSYVIIEKLIPTLADGEFPATATRDLWMPEKEAESLFTVERALFGTAVSQRDLNDWRAYSTTLVSKANASAELSDSTKDYIFDLCHNIMGSIGQWKDGLEDEAMSSELQNILGEAVQFSKLIRTQRANWSVRFPLFDSLSPAENLQRDEKLADPNTRKEKRRRLQFNRVTMQSVQPHDEDEITDNKVVDIFVTPALFKRGDADGAKFDVCSVIEPSAVLWADGPPPVPQASKPVMPQGRDPHGPNTLAPLQQSSRQAMSHEQDVGGPIPPVLPRQSSYGPQATSPPTTSSLLQEK